MATKKDLVEAYSFSRRRLVTAFVSGAPGGREVEPTRPGRTIVGGVAIAVLLAAGAAIAGVFSPTAPTDWKKQGMILSKETGSAYVIVGNSDDPVLRPVINPGTSAKLILGAEADPVLVAQDIIDEQQIGDYIGIFGAPVSVPTPALLIDDGWTACTAADAGIRLQVTETPDVTPAERSGVTVTNGGDYFVVLPTADPAQPGAEDPGAYVYPVPPQGKEGNQTDNLLSALNVQTTEDAIPVSREWIDLFPAGAPLTWSTFGVTQFGETPSYAADDTTGVLSDKFYGDLLDLGDRDLLLTAEGPVELSEFAATVYRNVVAPGDRVVTPKPIDVAPRVPRQTQKLLADAHWPTVPPEDDLGEPCAQLSTEHGHAPVAHLVLPGESSSAIGVPAGAKDPEVEAGRGAYVLSGGWTDAELGSPFFVDSRGRANPLVGSGTAGLLGYDGYPVVVVPDSWVELFDCGVNLSHDAALAPPSQPDDPACA